MKTWRLIYDGNINAQATVIEITEDVAGVPLAELDLEEWVCECKLVATATGILFVDDIYTNTQIQDKDLSVDTALPFTIHRTTNPLGSRYVSTKENQNSAVKMATANVSTLYSFKGNEIDKISFKNSSAGAAFTTDSHITIYAR